jgi:Rrf2 family protein
MAFNNQFSIAVHVMAGLSYNARETTSSELAGSVNTSPSFVRRVLAKLSRAGLIETTMGKTGACRLAKNPRQISLLDIYRAVGAPRAFAVHTYKEQKDCRVSCHIKGALNNALNKAQKALDASLGNISLAQVVKDIKTP